LNLVGTLLPGNKVPAVSGNRIVYRDGLPAAVRVGSKQQLLLEDDQQAVQEKLIRL
jgi:ATP-dependent Lhr-like helicase